MTFGYEGKGASMPSRLPLPKKLVTLVVLEILWQRSDEEHRLSQDQIRLIMADEYLMVVDRKTVKRTLDLLTDFGFELEYSVRERRTSHGVEETTSDYYLVHGFSAVELRIIIDSLVGQNALPTHQRNQLIEKIEHLYSNYFESKMKRVVAPSGPSRRGDYRSNKQFFYIVDVLDEAIADRAQVRIRYGRYDIDKALHSDAESLLLNPYQMIVANGRYYLSASVEGSGCLRSFRIDRILYIEKTSSRSTPIRALKEDIAESYLPENLSEQLYMFSGKPVRIRMRVDRSALNYVFDWFSDLLIENATPTTAEVVVRANEQAMRYWALQFADYVEVLEPKSLRLSLKKTADELACRYE